MSDMKFDLVIGSLPREKLCFQSEYYRRKRLIFFPRSNLTSSIS